MPVQVITKAPSGAMAMADPLWLSAVVVLTRNSRALRHAGGVVSLGVDAVAAAVLEVARPGDDEVAGRVHRHATGVIWLSAVVVLTRNSAPCAVPSALKRWA